MGYCYKDGDIRSECLDCRNSYVDDLFYELMCRLNGEECRCEVSHVVMYEKEKDK